MGVLPGRFWVNCPSGWAVATCGNVFGITSRTCLVTKHDLESIARWCLVGIRGAEKHLGRVLKYVLFPGKFDRSAFSAPRGRRWSKSCFCTVFVKYLTFWTLNFEFRQHLLYHKCLEVAIGDQFFSPGSRLSEAHHKRGNCTKKGMPWCYSLWNTLSIFRNTGYFLLKNLLCKK